MPAKRKAANVGAEVAQATATSADAPAVLPKQTKISAAPCSTGSTAPLSTLKGRQAGDALQKMIEKKVHDSGKGFCLFQGVPGSDSEDDPDEDNDSDTHKKEMTYAEMLKVLKYMLLTKVHTDAFDDASRAVAEVMFGDRYEHPTHLVRAIHDGSYTRPTTEDVGDAL